jgi:anti-sigma regulatory factor (Ser/Thr protein kinase)
MITLENLDLQTRQASLRVVSPALEEDAATEKRLRQALVRLGIDRVEHLTGSHGRQRQPAAPVATMPVPALVHELALDGAVPVYVARCPHRRDTLEILGLWADAVLGTRGPVRGRLHQARLALYELCANALEHGRPLQAGADIVVTVRLEPDAIECRIQDQCERFDPGAPRDRSLAEHVARRPTRGYGLHLVGRLVDRLSHVWEGNGNAIDFRKELRT